MADLKNLAGDIARSFANKARLFHWASLAVKTVLVLFATLLAGIAQFAQFPPSGPTFWQIIGIAACLVAFIGSAFVIFTEQDSSAELKIAHDAVEKARELERDYEEIFDILDDNSRLVELYQSMTVMRGTIERLSNASVIDEDDAVEKLLRAAERSLVISMGFKQEHQWTLGIYKAVPDERPDRACLKCIAQKRAIECDISEARVWKEGTGITGSSYANGDEIIVPNLQIEGLKAVFGTSANTTRDYDNERYRSMIAVPVKVDGIERPWGIVTATNDVIGHFSAETVPGVGNEEGARALAAMVALAVAMLRSKQIGAPV